MRTLDGNSYFRNLWLERPRLFGLALAVGFSLIVWSAVYLVADRMWPRAEAPTPGASGQNLVEARSADAGESTTPPALEPVDRP